MARATTEMAEDVPRRDRIFFYAGLLAALIGSLGFALGALLHDPLRIPVGGGSFESFGFVEGVILATGLVLTVAGVVLVKLGLRGGVRPKEGVS